MISADAATTERPDDILTPDDVAAKLRLSRSTVVQLMAEGKIPAMKMGRQWRCRRDAVDEYSGGDGDHEAMDCAATDLHATDRKATPIQISAIEMALDAVAWQPATDLPKGGSVGGGARVTHVATINGRETVRCYKLSTGARVAVVGEADSEGVIERRRTAVPHVYFVRDGGGKIKIGISTDVARRLDSIQTSSPVGMELLASFAADQATEKRLHRAFADEHIRGEWFEPSARLMTFIESVYEIENETDLVELLPWL